VAELNWTDEAQRWLHEIYDYIARDNLQAAARTIGGMYAKA
jgi:plasmid stabilization system protein ParE